MSSYYESEYINYKKIDQKILNDCYVICEPNFKNSIILVDFLNIMHTFTNYAISKGICANMAQFSMPTDKLEGDHIYGRTQDLLYMPIENFETFANLYKEWFKENVINKFSTVYSFNFIIKRLDNKTKVTKIDPFKENVTAKDIIDYTKNYYKNNPNVYNEIYFENDPSKMSDIGVPYKWILIHADIDLNKLKTLDPTDAINYIREFTAMPRCYIHDKNIYYDLNDMPVDKVIKDKIANDIFDIGLSFSIIKFSNIYPYDNHVPHIIHRQRYTKYYVWEQVKGMLRELTNNLVRDIPNFHAYFTGSLDDDLAFRCFAKNERSKHKDNPIYIMSGDKDMLFMMSDIPNSYCIKIRSQEDISQCELIDVAKTLKKLHFEKLSHKDIMFLYACCGNDWTSQYINNIIHVKNLHYKYSNNRFIKVREVANIKCPDNKFIECKELMTNRTFERLNLSYIGIKQYLADKANANIKLKSKHKFISDFTNEKAIATIQEYIMYYLKYKILTDKYKSIRNYCNNIHEIINTCIRYLLSSDAKARFGKNPLQMLTYKMFLQGLKISITDWNVTNFYELSYNEPTHREPIITADMPCVYRKYAEDTKYFLDVDKPGELEQDKSQIQYVKTIDGMLVKK